MLGLILRRILWMAPTLLIISILSFIIMQLPPGDYLTSYIAALEESGEPVQLEQVAALRARYHLDDPYHVQYLRWMSGLLKGDLGMSFEWNRPVIDLIGEQLLLTVVLSLVTLLVTWLVAIPIGIFSAVRQYTVWDYLFTFIGFIGLATPDFLLALILMFVGYRLFGVSAGGLFSPEYQLAPWSLAKVGDLFSHLWIPVVIIGFAGTASLIRVMRANLLDELRKPYVVTARAKGVSPVKLLLKYPVRVAINPLVSTVGWLLPAIVSGSVIVAVVLGLPTIGPLFLRALMSQDMYLAGSMVMLLSFLTVIGTLLSDLLLLWLDPRIRYERQER
ncbi:MAG: ABC transporter permease [Candidatus Hydrogenedentes bacterium]|nr:ABC transporter permease [Candidatus Hydrogenedentota bacterium]